MTTINLIAAIGRRGQVGLDGGLPWHAPADLAWFRQMTTGGVVVLGERTYNAMARQQGRESPILPGRFLAPFARHNTPEGFLSLMAMCWVGWPIWIAGGAHTWRAFAPHINGLKLISVVDYDGPADAWFPFDAYGMTAPVTDDTVERACAAYWADWDRMKKWPKTGPGIRSSMGLALAAAISTPKLAANAVTMAKIAAGAVTANSAAGAAG